MSPASGAWWALPALLAALVSIVGVIGWVQRADSSGDGRLPREFVDARPPSPRPRGETVSLEIDFGNGARRDFAALPWRGDMTVADVMQAAREFSPGIVYQQQGDGATAFLTSLEGVASEPGGGRYWQVLVNGEPLRASFGIHSVAAGDRVLWRFASGNWEMSANE